MTEIKDKNSDRANPLQNNNVKLDKTHLQDTNEKSASVFVDKKLKRAKAKSKTKEQIYETENYKKKTFAHRLRTLGILIFLAIFSGSGLGVWYYNNMLRVNTDWETLFTQVDEYLPNYSKTFENISVPDTPNGKEWVQIAHTQNKTPLSVSAIDNFILAEWNANHSSSFSAIADGKVATLGITQAIHSEKKFDGETYGFLSESNGIISVLSLSLYQPSTEKVTMYSGSKNKNDEASWTKEDEMSINDYTEIVGTSLNNIHPYIVSEKTVVESSDVVYDETTGNYNFTLKLDNQLSVIKYTKQVKMFGDLGSYPEFEYITLNVTIDQNWNLISLDTKESYSAIAYGMKVSCEGQLFNNYTFDDEVKLPI